MFSPCFVDEDEMSDETREETVCTKLTVVEKLLDRLLNSKENRVSKGLK